MLGLILPVVSMAQKDSLFHDKFDKFFFSVSIGRTIPFGKFASYRSQEDNYTGPPAKGIGYKLGAMYFFTKNFGLTSSYYRTLNESPPLNQEQVYPEYPGGGLGGGSNVTSLSYWAGNWQTHNLLFGLTLQADCRYLRMHFRLSGGWQQIKTPEIRIHGNAVDWSISGPTFVYYSFSNQQRSATGKAFVINPGADLCVRIKKGLGIMVGVDIFSSHSDFKLNTTHKASGGKNYTDERESTITKSITYLCFNGGIYYILP